MRAGLRRLIALAIVPVVLAVAAGVALAAGTISSPASPFMVPADAGGNPQSFTVVATGFAAGKSVKLEICDGLDPTNATWDVNLDCDLGTQTAGQSSSGPAAVLTFTAGDVNFGIKPFRGASPQGLFECFSPGVWPDAQNGTTDPDTQLPGWNNCQVRAVFEHRRPNLLDDDPLRAAGLDDDHDGSDDDDRADHNHDDGSADNDHDDRADNDHDGSDDDHDDRADDDHDDGSADNDHDDGSADHDHDNSATDDDDYHDDHHDDHHDDDGSSDDDHDDGGADHHHDRRADDHDDGGADHDDDPRADDHHRTSDVDDGRVDHDDGSVDRDDARRFVDNDTVDDADERDRGRSDLHDRRRRCAAAYGRFVGFADCAGSCVPGRGARAGARSSSPTASRVIRSG